ncbi:hypothetical protein F9881_18770, partial [Morganella morganii]|nr:hypothetical protein [Morganella morganii]
ASGRVIRLEVDGGIKTENIAAVAQAGADKLVAGSPFFGKPDHKTVTYDRRKELTKGSSRQTKKKYSNSQEPNPSQLTWTAHSLTLFRD